MSKEKFKVEQAVSFPMTGIVGKYQRKGGFVREVKEMYELKDENKKYYPNGVCRGELTTIKYLSKGKFKGYAYVCQTIQPKGYITETVLIEEFKLRLSSEKQIINSYNINKL
tara:strand:+ start:206 stop:541 length:336 start_codon:yes stop_codon:yes gene_type:complete